MFPAIKSWVEKLPRCSAKSYNKRGRAYCNEARRPMYDQSRHLWQSTQIRARQAARGIIRRGLQISVGLTRFNGHGFKGTYAVLRSCSSYRAGLT
jgi:hypothetical protein